MRKARKNKYSAWIGTILFHTILVIIFLFTGLSYTIPPPPEEGININFGVTDFGKGDEEPTSNTEEEISTEEVSENSSTDDIIKQETTETIKTKEKEEKEDIEEKEENKESKTDNTKTEKKEKKVNKKAIYDPNKNNQGDGNDSEVNNIGDIDGDPDSKNNQGGGFGNGLSSIDNSRSKPDKFDHTLDIGNGYIIVNVIVDAQGNIVEIDDSSLKTTLALLTDHKKKKLYESIKKDLKYGPANGEDTSNKIAELKIIFKQ